MYTRRNKRAGSKLQVPAFIALAGSQSEGPLVAYTPNGQGNARAHMIPVYIPVSDESGVHLGILH